jgi:hypothetical protein
MIINMKIPNTRIIIFISFFSGLIKFVKYYTSYTSHECVYLTNVFAISKKKNPDFFQVPSRRSTPLAQPPGMNGCKKKNLGQDGARRLRGRLGRMGRHEHNR